MLVQGLVKVLRAVIVIPDALGIDHHVGAELAPVEAARGVDPDVLDAESLCLLSHIGAQLLPTAGAPPPPGIPFLTHIRPPQFLPLLKARRTPRPPPPSA